MDYKINLILLLLIIFLYKFYDIYTLQETFINNNQNIDYTINHTYGLDKRCDLENPKAILPNALLVKSNSEQLYKNPKYDIKYNKGFKDNGFLSNSIQFTKYDENNKSKIIFYKNKCVNKCYNKCFKNCMNKYIDLDREILKVPLYIYPELYYHPLDEPN
jgi:hypothetical protein